MVIDLANSCDAFYTDKTTIVDVINKQSSKHPLVMFLIRVSVLTSFKLNILLVLRSAYSRRS